MKAQTQAELRKLFEAARDSGPRSKAWRRCSKLLFDAAARADVDEVNTLMALLSDVIPEAFEAIWDGLMEYATEEFGATPDDHAQARAYCERELAPYRRRLQ